MSIAESGKRISILTAFTLVGTALQIGLDNRKDSATKNPLHKTPLRRQVRNAAKAVFSSKQAWQQKGRELNEVFKPTATKETPGTAKKSNIFGRSWTAFKANKALDTMIVFGTVFAVKPDVIAFLKNLASPKKPAVAPVAPVAPVPAVDPLAADKAAHPDKYQGTHCSIKTNWYTRGATASVIDSTRSLESLDKALRYHRRGTLKFLQFSQSKNAWAEHNASQVQYLPAPAPAPAPAPVAT